MALTGTQYQQLQNALLSAFPNQASLAQMVRFQLDQVLGQIADGSNDTERVFNLIGWAEANGKLDALLDGALAANPGSETLRAVVAQLRPAPEAAPPARGAPIPWPDSCVLIDAQMIAEADAQAAAANPQTDSLYTRLGAVALWHIAAGQDAPRDLTKRLLEAIAALGAAPGMRFQLIRATGGNGKSTLLLRLAYKLARDDATVLVAAEGAAVDAKALRAACTAAGRRVYLLIDNAYRYNTPLLTGLETFSVPNLTIIATSRYHEIAASAPQPGPWLLAEPADLGDLSRDEAAELLARVKSCGALKAPDPDEVLRSAQEGQEPLLVAVARLTRVGGLETDVHDRLIEMNAGRDPVGYEPEAWTEFLRIYYAVAVNHAWGATTPQTILSALTGLSARRVNALLCDPATQSPTAQAREYLRGGCGGAWRTDHELIASRAVRYLADPAETPRDRFAALLARLAPESGPAPRPEAATLAGALLRRFADTPTLLFPEASGQSGLDTLAPIQATFTLSDTPPTPAHAALAAALEEPTLAAPLTRLRTVAPSSELANNYAFSYLRLCRWDDAVVVAGAALADPELSSFEQAFVLIILGNAHYQLKNYEQALADYTRSLALRPDVPETLYNRGTTYDEMGRYEEALADYTHSLDLQPNDPATLGNRGSTYAKTGRYAEALADYTRSLDLRPNDPAALSNRGVAYAKMRRYAEALADYANALKLDANHSNALYNLACLYSLQGSHDAALGTLDLAIRVDPPNRQLAQTDSDFDSLRDDPAFRSLVGLPPSASNNGST